MNIIDVNSENIEKSFFKPSARDGKINKEGFVLYYCNQCPFTEKYVPMIEEIAKKKKY